RSRAALDSRKAGSSSTTRIDSGAVASGTASLHRAQSAAARIAPARDRSRPRGGAHPRDRAESSLGQYRFRRGSGNLADFGGERASSRVFSRCYPQFMATRRVLLLAGAALAAAVLLVPALCEPPPPDDGGTRIGEREIPANDEEAAKRLKELMP